MRKKASVLSFLFLFLLTPGFGQDREKEEREAAKYYEKWLNQDVVHLITDDERDVFEKLTTSEEKDQFIEQFWRRRDTDLTTAINEYREEHYRRVAYANQHFGSGIPGWKTDRGRIYIMFGEPAQREYYAGGGTYVRKPYEGGGRTATYPFEIWRYRHIPGVGEDIEIEFVDRSWTGEFKLALYPWEKDMLLHVDRMGETTAERLGMARRYERPGLHPGHLNNTAYMKRFMGTRFKDRPFERLRQFFDLQRPPQIKQKELQTIVETKVSYSMLPFTTVMHHVWIDDEEALVPITVEVPNKSLKYFKRGNIYKARVGIYGRVSTMLGQVVNEFEDIVASEYQVKYLSIGQQQKSLYQKVLTLQPGRYKVELVIKDLTSGDLGTLTSSIHLTGLENQKMVAGPIMLAEQLESLEDFPETPQSFVIGDVRVVPNVKRQFRASDQLGVYLQIYNPTLDSATLEPAVSIEYTIARGDKAVSEVRDEDGLSIGFFSPERLVLVRKMDLASLEKGRYRLKVKVIDSISGQSSSSQADFEVIEGS
ncbi:GWxTD domain-containing protein [Acidobacteria bacterium AH-259-A15]|nr:GWxTD domain-containing protein [Acidobacteria bacterium AH-259-A15]